YRNFLQRNLPEILQPGSIETPDGKVIGEHNGLANYTIGQRKGSTWPAWIPSRPTPRCWCTRAC
ncbi:MAG: hypothetical protein J0M20_12395, partial [Burkholderiales bacterium]|nr:hypothetical protein [Burkholderiales bacterium]